MNHVIELLQQLGFGEYEARAYITLLRHHPANGYALAKESGIPRANIYGVLQKLEERGAVIAVDTAGGVAYSPVEPEALIRLLGSRYQSALDAAKQSLEQVATPVEAVYVQNIQGYEPLLEHARELIGGAQHELTIALWQPEALELAAAMQEAKARGVAIDTLCFQACAEPCGGCQGNLFRYHVTPPESARWLVVIRDGSDMAAGTTGEEAAAIRTRQPGLIELVNRYIRHSLTLAAVLSDLGGNLETMLQPQTRALLQVIGHGSSWLEFMRRLVQTS
jgi:sugar-specific transcriptional regulator TrmB